MSHSTNLPWLSSLYQLLSDSEALLRHQFGGRPLPEGCGGWLDLGGFCYFLANPPPELAAFTREVVARLPEPPPATKLDEASWNEIVEAARGYVASDGTLFGTSRYQMLDRGWIALLVYALHYQLQPDLIPPFPTHGTFVPGLSKPTIRIALAGDWGAGSGTSASVADAISSLAPDYAVHLGDVYYAGTSDDAPGPYPGWERSRLVDAWPSLPPGRAFALSSNHEMYAGGRGYYLDALRSEQFSAQRGSSHFALTHGPWTVVGLDSAYHSTMDSLFCEGTLGPPDGVQSRWLRQHFDLLSDVDRKVIVLTHHPALKTLGGLPPALSTNPWNALGEQVFGALGGYPTHWYWGHHHAGIAYGQTRRGPTRARCVGHGSIPMGKPSAAVGVEYVAGTLLGPGSPQVRNGFAMLTLGQDGSILEEMFEVDEWGGTHLMWHRAD